MAESASDLYLISIVYTCLFIICDSVLTAKAYSYNKNTKCSIRKMLFNFLIHVQLKPGIFHGTQYHLLRLNKHNRQ